MLGACRLRNRHACEAFTEEESRSALKGKWALIDQVDADGTAPCGSGRYASITAGGWRVNSAWCSPRRGCDTAIGGNSIPACARHIRWSLSRLIPVELTCSSARTCATQSAPNGKLTVATLTARGMHGSHRHHGRCGTGHEHLHRGWYGTSVRAVKTGTSSVHAVCSRCCGADWAQAH